MPFEEFEKPPILPEEEKEEEEKVEEAEEEKIEKELTPEDLELAKEIASETISHPMVEKGLARYEMFSKYYFEGLEKSEKEELEKEGIEPPSPEEIKQRADEVLGEDIIYQEILKLERPVKKEDFIEPITKELKRRELKKEEFDKLREAKEEGKEKFNEVFKEIFINLQIEREIKEREKKGIVAERVGNMYVEVINDECRPHLPRIAEDWPETLRGMKEAYQRLAELLQTDKRFKTVKRLEGISWLFGQEKIKQDFERTFGWHPYSEEEIEKFSKENPEVYKDIQKTGIAVSPRLFKKYLLTGEMPKIGGRWITKEEFIEKMKG